MDGLINKECYDMWSPCDKKLKEEKWRMFIACKWKPGERTGEESKEKAKEAADCVRKTYWCVKAASVKK